MKAGHILLLYFLSATGFSLAALLILILTHPKHTDWHWLGLCLFLVPNPPLVATFVLTFAVSFLSRNINAIEMPGFLLAFSLFFYFFMRLLLGSLRHNHTGKAHYTGIVFSLSALLQILFFQAIIK